MLIFFKNQHILALAIYSTTQTRKKNKVEQFN